jgi:hypothetical protein
MATPGFPPHRQNQDGSYDSICSVCYPTVATAESLVVPKNQAPARKNREHSDRVRAPFCVMFPVVAAVTVSFPPRAPPSVVSNGRSLLDAQS